MLELLKNMFSRNMCMKTMGKIFQEIIKIAVFNVSFNVT